MRRTELSIGGVTYPMCYSLRVSYACMERYGSMSGMVDALSGKEGEADVMTILTECLWIIKKLLDAGYRAAALDGETTPEPPSEDDLLDRWGLDDLAMLRGALFGTITAGAQREVEAVPAPNAEEGGQRVQLTPVWYLWYGMACGLDREEALDLPFGALQDLVAVYQIKREGCRYRAVLPRDEEIIPDVR